ncbi:hypothetical protein [Polyangium jinanense]|uniref:Uncharacterized protein n=1 Tax=Polyangium jinanense TaxID=2829994 RepID=A0A9X3XAI3_9BACT|nr:hypothetical protein [Polyangium jinanense]MDC3960468.1 hypothetical protein [Polyangium jinanense]MDC3986759.1 hypothetical protein [Polyangium jinanense]
MVLALGSIACGTAIEDEPQATPPAHVDLFACGVQLSCPAYCIHLSIADCSGGGSEPPTCPGDVWLQGESGAIEVHDRPGPGNWMGDKLTLLLGDGRALVQGRTRACQDGGFCDLPNMPWELGAHELCDVADPPDTCQPGNCTEFPKLVNCVPLETDWTCGEVTTAMAPTP